MMGYGERPCPWSAIGNLLDTNSFGIRHAMHRLCVCVSLCCVVWPAESHDVTKPPTRGNWVKRTLDIKNNSSHSLCGFNVGISTFGYLRGGREIMIEAYPCEDESGQSIFIHLVPTHISLDHNSFLPQHQFDEIIIINH